MGPLANLMITLAVLAAAAVLFWPERGLFHRWREVSRVGERVRIEDALKHLHEAEYRGYPATVDSVAGTLGIGRNDAAALVADVEARGLATRDGVQLRLTAEGRTWALHVIRAHRLWERHLAEETGVRQEDWHEHAERREHQMSPEEADALAARMGHPRYDPHGDPIPTSEGELPPFQGLPLPELRPGKFGTIVHVEDEPRAIYAQLVAEELHPGMRVEMVECSPERVRFWAEGDEHVLAPVVAANVTFVPLPEEDDAHGPFESLASLEPGEAGRVMRIAASCRGLQRRRLMDLGLVPGTDVRAEMKSNGGDPTAYRIRGTLVALRQDQAKQVHISRVLEDAR